jgi:hypothetical protein
MWELLLLLILQLAQLPPLSVSFHSFFTVWLRKPRIRDYLVDLCKDGRKIKMCLRAVGCEGMARSVRLVTAVCTPSNWRRVVLSSRGGCPPRCGTEERQPLVLQWQPPARSIFCVWGTTASIPSRDTALAQAPQVCCRVVILPAEPSSSVAQVCCRVVILPVEHNSSAAPL